MKELTLAEVTRLMEEPELIWAPNGTTFVYRIIANQNAQTLNAIFDSAAFIRHELRGPGEEPHLWVFSADMTLLDDPDHENLNPSWALMATVALNGYRWLWDEWPIL
jgi:hypothetical protein